MNLEKLKEKFPEAILKSDAKKSSLCINLAPQDLHACLAFCKAENDLAFDMLIDIVAVDYLENYLTEEARFELVYLLYSTQQRHRLQIKTRLQDGESIATTSDLYKSADWAEREVFDMFGIKFDKHPNLKRILMFEGFEGHPLRKDYKTNHRQKIPVMKEVP